MAGSNAKKIVVDIDNASAHNARVTRNFFEHNPLKRLRHPPYSRDISPSDFYLFGKMKNALIGREISDEIDLLEVVTEILSGISHDEWRAVFRNWVERVQTVIDAWGLSVFVNTLLLIALFESRPLWRV
jgi:transposase